MLPWRYKRFLLFMREGKEAVDEQVVRQALEKTHWAGRLERIRPQIYLDGAHNLPALICLVEFVKEKRAGRLSSSNPLWSLETEGLSRDVGLSD